MKAGSEIDEKCLEIFTRASQDANFGNGRFVRNLLEQAQIKQSGRIMREYGGHEIDRNILMELRQEDFDVNTANQYVTSHPQLGFTL